MLRAVATAARTMGLGHWLERRAGHFAVLLMCSTGCRYGFTELPITDASMIDVPHADAPPDARIVARTFGERPGSMVTGVTVDTTVANAMPTTNFGPTADLSAYGGGAAERGLLRFDLSSIAPGTLVAAARLELEIVDFGDEIAGGLALRLAGEAWTEAGASWNERQVGTTWTSAGGTASAAITTVAAPSAAVVFTVSVTVPQSWIDAPAANFGFVVAVSDEAVSVHYHLHTSESLVLTGRPQLVLDLAQ